jgi:hypothetical protein
MKHKGKTCPACGGAVPGKDDHDGDDAMRKPRKTEGAKFNGFVRKPKTMVGYSDAPLPAAKD